jgi:ABC-2 type transport system ATP-binding protein
MSTLSRLTALLLVALLGGCSYHTQPPRMHSANQAVWPKYYHAEVDAEDGTRIRMTVYQPALKPGQTAPLLIHAHGFALHRMKRPLSLYGQVLLAGRIAKDAWKDGYWVISFDQRGFGNSEGSVGLIRPEKEGRDVSRVIDWAVRYLPIAYRNNDPVVGMIGESYGGGVQMAATLVDKRIDALVPLTTWSNLDKALYPNNVAKTDWLTLLGTAGYAVSPLSMDSNVATGTLSEVFGKGDPWLRNLLRANSLVEHCGGAGGPQADALLIQGMRDVLFPFNQALDARQCFQRAGRDVRLLAIEHGHMMPGSQWYWGFPVWNAQSEVTCDGKRLKTAAIIRDWLNGKLRGDAAALARVPAFCVTGDAVADAMQARGEVALQWQALPKVHVGSGLAGRMEYVAQPLDRLGNLLVPARLPKDWQRPGNGWLRPARVPLFTPTEPTWIAGAPRVELSCSDTDREKAVVFLRLAVWRPGAGSYRVLNDQVTPVRCPGAEPFEVELAAVRARLAAGEVLGLLVEGYSNQFRLSGSGLGVDASVAGRIGLPLIYPEQGSVARQEAVASQPGS